MIMNLTSFYILTTTFVFTLEHEDSSSARKSAPYGGPVEHLAARPHRREKRCSCDNLKDKECVYFCHIGIVWVNTPSHIVPYGVGSFPVRLRRELGRCFCTEQNDSECLSFCSAMHSLNKLKTIWSSRSLHKSLQRDLRLDKRNQPTFIQET